MSGPVSAPDRNASRAHAADWVELKVLQSSTGVYRSSQYTSALGWDSSKEDDADDGFVDDDAIDEFAGDPEIMEGVHDALLERASDEIRWRASVLGELYPFELRSARRGWELRLRAALAPSRVRTGRTVYTVCLLLSAARHGRLPGLSTVLTGTKPVADTFQRAVYLVAPALLGGPSFWIAFPRPEADDYGPALERLTVALGSGLLRRKKPPSQTSNKDGGVDIVTWRPFGDGRSNVLVSYGQVASGKRWRDKSVENKLKSHFHKWFEERPSGNYVPAMYIPHVMHEELRLGRKDTWEELLQDDAHTMESLLGVVVDRIRMTLFAPEAARLREGWDPGVADQLRTIVSWLVETRSAMRSD